MDEESYIKEILRDIKFIKDLPYGKLPNKLILKLIELSQLIIEPFTTYFLGYNYYSIHLKGKFMKIKDSIKQVNRKTMNSITESLQDSQELISYILNPGDKIITQTFEFMGISELLLLELEKGFQLENLLLNHATKDLIHTGYGLEKPFRLIIELTNLRENPMELIPARVINGELFGPEAFKMKIKRTILE